MTRAKCPGSKDPTALGKINVGEPYHICQEKQKASLPRQNKRGRAMSHSSGKIKALPSKHHSQRSLVTTKVL